MAEHIGEIVRRVAQQVVAADLNVVWGRVQQDPVDEEALRELVDRWGSGFLSYCGAMLGDSHAAEDVVSAAFAALVRHRAVPPTAEAALRYLWKTVARAARRARSRAARRRDRTPLDDTQPPVDPRDSDPAAHAVRAEVVADVSAALGKLSENERCAVVLVSFLGHTEDDAASVMGCSRSSVSTYLTRAREKLARLLARWKETVAAGGGATVETMLTDAARAVGIPPRSGTLVESILRQAAAPVKTASGWAKAALVLLALSTAGGMTVAMWPAPVPPPDHPSRLAVQTPTETLQAKNLRILHAEVIPRVMILFQESKLLPPDNPWRLDHSSAVGSKVGVALAPTRNVRGMPDRVHLEYCTLQRHLWGNAHSWEDGKWRGINPDGPVNVWAPFLGRRVAVGKAQWAKLRQVFELLPRDDRAERELVLNVFGPGGWTGEDFTITNAAAWGGLAGNASALFAGTGREVFVGRGPGAWRYWGTPAAGARFVTADDTHLYFWDFKSILSQRLDDPNGTPIKLCEAPPGELRSMAVSDGVGYVSTEKPGEWYQRPLGEPAASWTRHEFTTPPLFFAATGRQVFAADDKSVFRRKGTGPNSQWPLFARVPTPNPLLAVWGDRLLAVPRGPGPIQARPLAADPDAPWEVIGWVHEPPE